MFFTSHVLATLKEVNGWPKAILVQYYQKILNMKALPWARFVSEHFENAQFSMPSEPSGEAAQHARRPPFKAPPQEKPSSSKAKATMADGYCLSQLEVIDPHNQIDLTIRMVRGVDTEELSTFPYLEDSHLGASEKLVNLQEAMAEQEKTLERLSNHCKKINDEQLLLAAKQKELQKAEAKIREALALKAERHQRQQKQEQVDELLAEMKRLNLKPEDLEAYQSEMKPNAPPGLWQIPPSEPKAPPPEPKAPPPEPKAPPPQPWERPAPQLPPQLWHQRHKAPDPQDGKMPSPRFLDAQHTFGAFQGRDPWLDDDDNKVEEV